MKLLKAILFKLILVVMVCIVAFNLYNFICLNVLKEDLATVNGYAILEVVSGSMEPTIHVGDMIIIDTKVENFEKDDIITFYDVNGAFVTHRIISINGNKMITQGDNNESPDGEMSTDNIVGRVVNTIPAAGKILASLKSPLVMGLILVIGILICFLTSTDENLVPVDLTDEEKEFLEYKKNKVLEAKANNVNFVDYTEDDKKKTSKSTKKKSTKSSTKTESKKAKETTASKKTSAKAKATPVVKKTVKTDSKSSKTKASKDTTKKSVKTPVKTTKSSSSKTVSKKAATKATAPKTATKKNATVKATSKKVASAEPKSKSTKVASKDVKKVASKKNVATSSKKTTKATTKTIKSASTAGEKAKTTKAEKKSTKVAQTKKNDVKTIKKSTKRVTGTKKTEM